MKTITFLFAILFIAGFNSIQAQGTWTKKADLKGSMRTTAVGFNIGDKGYFGTGINYVSGSFYKDFWQYDPINNTWTQLADFGGTSRLSATGFSIGSKGYVGTGWDINEKPVKDFWEYDPPSNTWSRKADFAGGARAVASGFSIGNKGYLGTGFSGGCCPRTKHTDFWEYDPLNDTWTKLADFGGIARSSAVGFSIGSKGYIGTGSTESESPLSDFWKYDPSSNTWTREADFPGSPRANATGFSIDDKGYIGTGWALADNTSYKDFWEYNPASDSWSQKSDYGGIVRSGAIGFNIGSKGYIGSGSSYQYPKDFWEYTPEACQGLTVFADADSDGYGNAADTLIVADCIVPEGYVTDSTDCDDTNASIHPGISETTGDGIDNNCNGQVDENNALSFDGVNDYVSAPIPMTVIDNFTLEAWINPSLLSGIQVPVSYGNDNNVGATANGASICLNGNSLQVVFSGIAFFSTGYTFPSANQWYHIAFVRSNGTMQAYVNGIPAPNTSTQTPYIPTMFRVGSQTGIRFFNGKIDEVRIWNVARTQAEVQSDMNSTGCGDAPGLVAYYPFNQGSAGGNNTNEITADDITSNNNNGTLINFALTGSKSNWVTGVPGLNDFITFYQDADGDTYGDINVSIHASACNPPAGYVLDSTDCNDADSSVHPGAKEVINGVDDNCNDLIDEGNWKKETDFVRAGRYSAVAFTYGGKVYFGLGKTASGKFMKDFWEYDPATNVWTQKVNFRGSERFRAAAFSIGPKGYVGTGCDYRGTLVRDFWEYNIATNTWRQKANFRGTGRQYATGFSIGDKGYIGTGGDYITQHNDFWEYDPSTDSWKQKANVGNTTREAATGFSIANKGYIGLGYNSNDGYEKDFWEYDPWNDSWKRKANFGGKPRSAAAGFPLHKKGYIGTGSNGTSLYQDFWQYDPATDNWKQVADFTGESRAYAVGFSIGNNGYVGTGGNLSGDTYKDFWRYNTGAAPSVAITFFTAAPQATSVLLNWQTALEADNSYFSVERSMDGISFSEIGQAKSKGGFIDAKPVAGNNYYRLKQVDADGYFTYSKIVSLEFGTIDGYTLYPNPVKDVLHVYNLKGHASISIITQDGRVVDKKIVTTSTYAWNVKTLSAGAYYVRIEEGGKTSTLKFIK